MRRFAGIASALLLAAAPAHALPKILICQADANFDGGTMIQTLLANTKAFGAVDMIDCSVNTPSVAKLKMYDGVFLWDDNMFADPTTLGNNLADYVDAGGGVVQAQFNLYAQTFGISYQLGGRWLSGNYNCLNPADTTTFDSLNPKPNDATSPLVKDVGSLTSFNAGTWSFGGALVQGAKSVWDYSGGEPAIAACKVGSHDRVDLNFYPYPGNWTGDGDKVMRNALLFVSGGFNPLKASPDPVPFPDTGTGATSSPVGVTFTNTAMTSQTVTALSITGTNASDFGLSTGPTLPVTLAPGGTITASLVFSPTGMGMRSATLQLTVTGQTSPATADLVGNGIGAKLTVTPSPIAFGGTQIGMTLTQDVTVANVGGGKLTITMLAVDNPAFAITSVPDLPIVIGGIGSFPVTLTFTPATNGLTKGTLTITSDDPNTPTLNVPLSGYSGPPAISLDASAIAFGSINLGAKSVEQMVTITNSGFSDLTVSSVQLAGANAGDFAIDASMLAGTIPAQGSSTVGVTFAPTAIGARNGQLLINSNDANNPSKTVILFGTGTTAMVSVAPMTLDLGSARVGATTAAGTFGVTSMGSGSVHVATVTFDGADAADFAVSNTASVPPFAVPGGMTSQVAVTCTPSHAGAIHTNATVTTDVGNAMVAITCNGTAPVIAVTPSPLDFGDVPLSQASTMLALTVANNGTDTLNVASFTLAGNDAADFVSPDLPATLPLPIPAGQSTTIHVVFTPSRHGMESAELDVASDDPVNGLVKVALTGSGANAAVTVTPAPLDFGMVILGKTSQPLAVTIANTGEVAVTVSSVSLTGTSAGQFSVDQGGPFTLAPQATQVVHVTFTPAALGPVSATLLVQVTGLTSSQLALHGIGFQPTLQAALAGNARVLDFGSVTVGTPSMALPIHLKNSGTSSATITAVTSSDAQFAPDSSKTTKTLGPNAVTDVLVTFTPKAAAAATATITISVQDGKPVTVMATGLGTAAPTGGCSTGTGRGRDGLPLGLLLVAGLAWVARRRRSAIVALALLALAPAARASGPNPVYGQPGSLTFPDTGTGSVSASQSVMYINGGTASASITAITLGGTDPGDYQIVNPPPLPIGLGPGAAITVSVAFAPTNGGPRPATLSATVANQTTTADVSLSGNGIGPKISVSPSPIQVGGLPLGQAPPPVTATISNAGGSTVHVTALSLGGADVAQFMLSGVPSLPQALGPNQSFAVTITFAPTAVGQANATLDVISDDPNTPSLVTPIVGLAGSPSIRLDIGTIIFGNERVGIATPPQSVTISNAGYSSLHVSSVVLAGANPGDFAFSTPLATPVTIPVGGTATFAVTFTPTTAGARSAQVQIASDDPNVPVRKLSVSGVGTVPMASVMPPSVDFGMVMVGTMGTASLTIANKGTGPFNVKTLAITGPDAARFAASLNAPFSVPGGSSAVLQLSFAPIAIASSTATLSLTTDDPTFPSASIPLTGMGVAPQLQVAPLSLDFGGVRVGVTAPAQSFTLTNSGDQPLTIMSVAFDATTSAAFALTPMPSMPIKLPPGGTSTFMVTYSPTVAMADMGNVVILSDDPSTPTAMVTLSGFGLQPSLSVTPADVLAFGGAAIGSKVGPLPITIENTGGAPLDVTTLSISGTGSAPFSIDMQAPLTIAPMMSVMVNVTFSPQEVADYSATLTIDSTDVGVVPAMVMLTGSGVSQMLAASPTTYDFGEVPIGSPSVPATIVLHHGCDDALAASPNTACAGHPTVHIGKITSDDPKHFQVDTSPLKADLGDKGETTFNIVFTPDGSAPVSGTIKVYLMGATIPATRVLVTGSGVQGGGSLPGCTVAGAGARGQGAGAVAALLLVVALGARRRRAR